MPAALELDGGQVMAVIEAGGNQKQGIQVGAAIELMVFDQVLQFPVLLGTEVRGQRIENALVIEKLGHRQPPPVVGARIELGEAFVEDRKSTRLNSSH